MIRQKKRRYSLNTKMAMIKAGRAVRNSPMFYQYLERERERETSRVQIMKA